MNGSFCAIPLSMSSSETGRAYYERIVDVMEEPVRFTVLLRPQAATLTDRYSERVEAQAAHKRTTELAALATQ